MACPPRPRVGATTARVGKLSYTTAPSSDQQGIIAWGDDFYCSGVASPISVNMNKKQYRNAVVFNWATYGIGVRVRVTPRYRL